MNAKEKLRQAIETMIVSERSNPDAPNSADLLTDLAVAFADVLRGPAPEVIAGVGVEADSTPAQILAELKGLRADLAMSSVAVD